MATQTPNFSFDLPTVGADTDFWGAFLNGNWSSIDTLLKDIQDAVNPIGAIQLWYGLVAQIPTGFRWCDGSVYTRSDGQGSIQSPDLRSRFLVGTTGDSLGDYPQGGTGGGGGAQVFPVDVANHAITVAEMPQHSHADIMSNAITNSGLGGDVEGPGGSTDRFNINLETAVEGGSNAHTHAGSTVDLSTADLDPSWYALAYIIKI